MQATDEPGEDERGEDEQADAAGDLREGVGRGMAEHERQQHGKERGDDDVREEKRGDDVGDATPEETRDDRRGGGGRRNAAEKCGEGDVASADEKADAPRGGGDREIGGEEENVTAMQRFAREACLQKDDEQHPDHEPTNEPRGGMRLREQRTEDDGGEDGGGAGKTTFHKCSGAKTAVRLSQSNYAKGGLIQ